MNYVKYELLVSTIYISTSILAKIIFYFNHFTYYLKAIHSNLNLNLNLKHILNHM